MSKRRIGDLPRRYDFLLNPHPDTRLSICPLCDRPTHPRKFSLFVHVDDWGPIVLGKTCRYCSHSELIICHQDELDELLARAFRQLKPEVIGSHYLVIGTVDKQIMKNATAGHPSDVGDTIAHMADFKSHRFLDYDPGGYRHADADPARYIIKHDDAAARRKTPWTLAHLSKSAE